MAKNKPDQKQHRHTAGDARWGTSHEVTNRELRADAERNQKALLQAAEEVFTEHGANAPLSLITEKAELGRGTLYRHFPNRVALVGALYDRRIDRYEKYALEHQNNGEALYGVLRMIAWDQFSIPDLLRIIQENESNSPVYAAFWDRTEHVVETMLASAKEDGAVRDDVTVQDVILVISMFYGVANSPSVGRWGSDAVERSLVLIRRILS